ncbi:hypothetical protein [Candidatus Poriferisodalis sp.]|uniref:hypothetical protein n=1 Tax=Candidatus Poriferisodalis sp. TaxID=3101277 RepID=UPI003B017B2A
MPMILTVGIVVSAGAATTLSDATAAAPHIVTEAQREGHGRPNRIDVVGLADFVAIRESSGHCPPGSGQ